MKIQKFRVGLKFMSFSEDFYPACYILYCLKGDFVAALRGFCYKILLVATHGFGLIFMNISEDFYAAG